MIMKLLLVVGVITVIYMMFIKKKPEVSKTKQDNNSTNEKTPTAASNDMIECANCGIYCAMDDTILSGSKYYCSDECVGKA